MSIRHLLKIYMMERNTMTKNDFTKILDTYFTKHLSLERRFSENTYETYLNVLKQFIHYLTTIKHLKPKSICVFSFSKDNILDFLTYVETELGCSIRTRNHKLAVINSFLEYAQSYNPIYLDIYLQSKSIKLKKAIKEKMDYLTKKELEAFLKQINIRTKNGYKHYVIIALLYESGMRVSELINLRVDHLYFIGNSPYIKILGKGNKERIVYLNEDIVSMVTEYQSKFNIQSGYVFRNNSKKQLTRFSINKIVSKYHNLAKKECPTLERKTISPHSFRHSKAVHLLMNNTALPILQRFLGHASIQTTEIYLDITNDEVKKNVTSVASLIDIKEDSNAVWQGDEKLIELLERLSQ